MNDDANKSEQKGQEIEISSEIFAADDSSCDYMYSGTSEKEIQIKSDSADEKDYFGDENFLSNSDESNAVWEDSEDGCLSDGELLTTASWLTTKPPATLIKKSIEKIKFKITKNVVLTKNKIKIMKTEKELVVAVDTFNIVYFIKKRKIINAYKIDFFHITDIVIFEKFVLLASNKSSYMKMLDFNGKVSDIKKNIKNVVKMHFVKENLYIIGESLYRLDTCFNILNVFNSKFIDLCVNDNNLLCLSENGDLVEFDLNLVFLSKYSMENKFEFKRLWCNDQNYFIGRESGLTVLKKNDMSFIKEINNLKKPPTDLIWNGNFTIYGSDYNNSLRILKKGLVLYDRFPFSKIKVYGFKCLGIIDNIFYICHSNFITLLEVNYITVKNS